MDSEENIGFLLILLSILTIPFFFITVVLGSYRDVQPEFLQDIPIVDFLISNFPWDAVVLFFTSILVFCGLLYMGWVGYCMYSGKVKKIEINKRFIDLIYSRKKTEINEKEKSNQRQDHEIASESPNEAMNFEGSQKYRKQFI